MLDSKTRDSPFPFLFLIVDEGFSCLMRKAIETKVFAGLEIEKNKILISHLQFMHDIMLLGKMSVDNAKSLRGILKLFEIASGLRVNFHKSSIHKINLKISKWRLLQI